ncbi:phytoene desaturase family protein [Actinacidiphila bryophytorum]|uniref:Phytoene desaturase n=1 Tax=Actinacidiphila bryophytorum TaxID=1436133 RepID=A0A9W4GZP3_9ACTN|nr:NAD(P)/FAD-dependent oxidoreductase [Actinacidiphila bryophytorum]MBM9436272.1 NAD(P)/FAD-dependent oxidoreductase [Actinacidiphila bryophytorum]MBN6544592.1 NAD(P)/FAD-dependent oxidoreductase [Actinacidiphila bryophytorum]CAG7632336.1 Phytoene desaturase [Actinacidiphila bryophytorum]
MARIAVIGAGMASLAAAARLAVGGHQVVVLERTGTYGGAVGRLARDGFAFDTGPGLLTLPAVYRDLFVKTGRRPLEECVELVEVDPASRHVFADGTDLVLPNASRSGTIAAMDAAFGPGSGERWSELMVRARETWEVMRRPMLEDALPEDPWPFGRDPYPMVRRGFGPGRSKPSLAKVAAAELRDPRMAALLESHLLAHGIDPREGPASAAVLPYLEETFGVWYVRGGVRELARAVHERCLERRVDFRFEAEVANLLVAEGRTAGVRLADGSEVAADIVVAGSPVPAFYSDMGGWDTDSSPWPFTGPHSEGSRLTVHLALRGSRPSGTAHRTLVHAADRDRALDWLTARRPAQLPPPGALTVTVLRPDDPATRPDEGHEAVTLTAVVPAHEPARKLVRTVDWNAPGAADSFADLMVAAAEAAVPGLRSRELWREVRTPVDVERDTGVAGGAVPAPSLAGAGGILLRSANRSPFPGLYCVGGWAHPGGGLPHAGMSAAIASDLVFGGPGGSR